MYAQEITGVFYVSFSFAFLCGTLDVVVKLVVCMYVCVSVCRVCICVFMFVTPWEFMYSLVE